MDNWITECVPGHQDSKKDWHELTYPEKLNVHVDSLATKARYAGESQKRRTKSLVFPSSKIEVFFIDGQQITKNVESSVIRAWVAPKVREYWTQKYGWSDEVIDDGDRYTGHETNEFPCRPNCREDN